MRTSFLWVVLNFAIEITVLSRLQIRIYGMTYFNESSEYWGDRVERLVGAGNERLTARSVKIFADGMCIRADSQQDRRLNHSHRCLEIRRSCSKF